MSWMGITLPQWRKDSEGLNLSKHALEAIVMIWTVVLLYGTSEFSEIFNSQQRQVVLSSSDSSSPSYRIYSLPMGHVTLGTPPLYFSQEWCSMERQLFKQCLGGRVEIFYDAAPYFMTGHKKRETLWKAFSQQNPRQPEVIIWLNFFPAVSHNIRRLREEGLIDSTMPKWQKQKKQKTNKARLKFSVAIWERISLERVRSELCMQGTLSAVHFILELYWNAAFPSSWLCLLNSSRPS